MEPSPKRHCSNVQHAHTCYICLENDGNVISTGCGCKGSNGKCHIECLAELARVKQNSHPDDFGLAYITCNICKFYFSGEAYHQMLNHRKEHVKSGITFPNEEYQCIQEAGLLDHEARCFSINNPIHNEYGIQLAKKSYQMCVDMFGEYHSNALIRYNTYAMLHTGNPSNNYQEIVDKIYDIIEKMDRTYCSDFNLQTWYNTIGLLYLINGEYYKAEQIFTNILTEYEKLGNVRDAYKYFIKASLISSLLFQNDAEKKKQALDLLVEIWKPINSVFTRKHQQIHILESNLKKFEIDPETLSYDNMMIK